MISIEIKHLPTVRKGRGPGTETIGIQIPSTTVTSTMTNLDPKETATVNIPLAITGMMVGDTVRKGTEVTSLRDLITMIILSIPTQTIVVDLEDIQGVSFPAENEVKNGSLLGEMEHSVTEEKHDMADMVTMSMKSLQQGQEIPVPPVILKAPQEIPIPKQSLRAVQAVLKHQVNLHSGKQKKKTGVVETKEIPLLPLKQIKVTKNLVQSWQIQLVIVLRTRKV